MDDKRLPTGRASPDPNGVRLESWKEIAAYFKRDVTTLRRWEKQEGLPIHRLQHRKLGSVYAYRSELDAWRQRRARRGQDEPTADARVPLLAVLPLENLSRDPEQEYFADGMTEALITQLSSLHRLRVVSRSSVMQFKWRPQRSRNRAVAQRRCDRRGNGDALERADPHYRATGEREHGRESVGTSL